MANVFVNPYSGKGKAWSLQSCWMWLQGGRGGGGVTTEGGTGILAATESVQITYQRQINTRYPLMSSKAPIKILGVPNGTCTLGTILGPQSGVQQFLYKFGSSCEPFQLTLSQGDSNYSMAQTEDCQDANTKHKIILTGCMGTQLTYTIQMQGNMAVAQGNFVLTFDKMDWSSSQ